MYDQRQRRWADVVQMLYKCFVFARYTAHLWGISSDNIDRPYAYQSYGTE